MPPQLRDEARRFFSPYNSMLFEVLGEPGPYEEWQRRREAPQGKKQEEEGVRGRKTMTQGREDPSGNRTEFRGTGNGRGGIRSQEEFDSTHGASTITSIRSAVSLPEAGADREVNAVHTERSAIKREGQVVDAPLQSDSVELNDFAFLRREGKADRYLQPWVPR
jgi:hypothetical protein